MGIATPVCGLVRNDRKTRDCRAPAALAMTALLGGNCEVIGAGDDGELGGSFAGWGIIATGAEASFLLTAFTLGFFRAFLRIPAFGGSKSFHAFGTLRAFAATGKTTGHTGSAAFGCGH